MRIALGWLSGLAVLLAAACGGSVVDGAGGAGGGSTTASTGGSCDAPASKTCAGAGDCVLATTDCCLCGTPEVTDYVAVNQANADACACDGPVCDCATILNPNLAASCEAGVCVDWDVRKRSDYAGCQADSDCRLRFGLGCCEPPEGSDFELVAIRNDAEAAIVTAMCGPDDGNGCTNCLPTYPASKKAVCMGGFCRVAETGQSGSTGGCK